MSYQNTEIDPLVVVANKDESPVTKKKVYTMGGLVVLLLAALSFLAGQNSASNRSYLKTAASLSGIEADQEKPRIKKIGGEVFHQSQGTYIESKDLYNGQPLWDRAEGGRFAFYMAPPDGRWHFHESRFRAMFVGNWGAGSFGWSLNKAEDFIDAVFEGQTVEIDGDLYAGCQGVYKPTEDLFNGKPIWDRDDKQRFAFYNSDGKWAITAYSYRNSFVGKTGYMGAFVSANEPTQAFDQAWFPGQTGRIP